MLTQTEISRRARRAALALGSRQLIVQAINIGAGIYFSRALSPADFAVWGIVTLLLTVLVIITDAGLGSSLVRVQTEPTTEEYQTVFTAQQILALLLTAILWIFSETILELYKLDVKDIIILYALCSSCILSSLILVPQARLERQLSFGKLGVIEILQSLIFNGTSIVLIEHGIGAQSFGYAIFLRSLLGCALIYTLTPWGIRFHWNWVYLRKHLGFGLPFQATKLINLGKDLMGPIFIAVVAGTTALGYLNWSSMVIAYPLLAATLLQRLYMPLFARLAHDLTALREYMYRMTSAVSAVVYTLSLLIALFSTEITLQIFDEKWLVATSLFIPLTVVNILLSPSIVLISALNALGHATFVLSIQLLVTVMTWTVGTFSIHEYGWTSWGWANVVIHLSYIPIFMVAKKRLEFNVLPPIFSALLIAALSTIIAKLFSYIFRWEISFLLAAVSSFVMTYIVSFRMPIKPTRVKPHIHDV